MECTIYMKQEDVKRQALNVFRMEPLGAKVEAVTDGSRVLKDAVTVQPFVWRVAPTSISLISCSGLVQSHPFQKLFVTSKVLWSR